MTAEPTDPDALRQFAELLLNWGSSVGGPFTPQWREVASTFRGRSSEVAAEALDDDGWFFVAQALEALEDRAHRGSRSAAASAYLRAGLDGDAVRCWEASQDVAHRDYYLAKAAASSPAGRLRWLSRLPGGEADAKVSEAWSASPELASGRDPALSEVVAPMLERKAADASELADRDENPETALTTAARLYHEAFGLYLRGGTGDLDAALRCRDAARSLARSQRRPSGPTWTQPLLEHVIEHEQWSRIFTVTTIGDLPRSGSARADSIALWCQVTEKLAYVHGALFTDVFPAPEVLATLPDDGTRYRQLADRLLERSRGRLDGAPVAQIERNRFDDVLQVLRRENWQRHLRFSEFGAAHEHAGSLREALRFYEQFFQDRNRDRRETARLRWVVTKARQVYITTERGAADTLRRELNSRVGSWQGGSPLGG